MKNLKKIIFALLFISISNLFAKTLTFTEEKYSGSITFNDNVQLGDAIFVRLNIKFLKTQKKKNLKETQAVLKLFSNDRQIECSRFFSITPQKEKNNKNELLAAIPISTWLKLHDNFSLKIIFEPNISEQKEITIPFHIKEKTFISETIDLNQANTDIKTDMSPERLEQIEKLNTIFETIISEDVYDLKKFIKPVIQDRKTSFFADRRLYRYTNNETSTSMHNGIDYGVPEGTEVSSCAQGKVVMAENRISTGLSIVIEHLPGLYSVYYHLSSLNVKEGQIVKQGELIGLSGKTGLATGPHLHWEVRLNALPVSPEFFLSDYTYSEGELN